MAIKYPRVCVELSDVSLDIINIWINIGFHLCEWKKKLLQLTSSAHFFSRSTASSRLRSRTKKRKYSLWCIIQGSQVTLTNAGINIKSLSCKTEGKKKSHLSPPGKSRLSPRLEPISWPECEQTITSAVISSSSPFLCLTGTMRRRENNKIRGVRTHWPGL